MHISDIMSMKLKNLLLILICAVFFSQANAQVITSHDENAYTSNRMLFIQAARAYLGTPYMSGGTTKTGMDCSGLVFRAALDGLKLPLPRTVASLSARSAKISESALEPGDLLFFNTTGVVSHVAIFLGGSTFIHSASDGPRTGVIISSLSENYWKNAYTYAGRIMLQEGLKIPDGEISPAPEVNPFPSTGKIGLRINYTGGALWDFMPGEFPVRGASFNAEISWVKNISVYPGLGAGIVWDTRTKSLSLPVTISLTSIQGFRFFIGTQLHAIASSSLSKAPLFPGIIGLSWNSRPVDVAGQKVRFYQSVEYSRFSDETITPGLRFNTGLTISCDI